MEGSQQAAVTELQMPKAELVDIIKPTPEQKTKDVAHAVIINKASTIEARANNENNGKLQEGEGPFFVYKKISDFAQQPGDGPAVNRKTRELQPISLNDGGTAPCFIIENGAPKATTRTKEGTIEIEEITGKSGNNLTVVCSNGETMLIPTEVVLQAQLLSEKDTFAGGFDGETQKFITDYANALENGAQIPTNRLKELAQANGFVTTESFVAYIEHVMPEAEITEGMTEDEKKEASLKNTAREFIKNNFESHYIATGEDFALLLQNFGPEEIQNEIDEITEQIEVLKVKANDPTTEGKINNLTKKKQELEAAKAFCKEINEMIPDLQETIQNGMSKESAGTIQRSLERGKLTGVSGALVEEIGKKIEAEGDKGQKETFDKYKLMGGVAGLVLILMMFKAASSQ